MKRRASHWKSPHGVSRTPARSAWRVRACLWAKEWLVRKVRIEGGPAGGTEAGYEYTKFGGHTVLARVNMVMGALGFVKVTYSNYRKTPKVARAEFRVF
jgi:hypothetical protein